MRHTPCGSAAERFEDRHVPEPNSGCWLWTASSDESGYGRLNGEASGQRFRSAHRASWLLHKGAVPSGLFVLHKCDTPACVNPEHLFLGTTQDNVSDKMAKGRHPRCAPYAPARGERCHGSKLTAPKVANIKMLFALGASGVAISEWFGVNKASASAIRRGTAWRHVSGPV